MNMRIGFLAAVILVSANAVVAEQALPQQGWYVDHQWEVDGYTRATLRLAINSTGNIYVFRENGQTSIGIDNYGIRIYDDQGTLLNPGTPLVHDPYIVPNFRAYSMDISPVDGSIVFAGQAPFEEDFFGKLERCLDQHNGCNLNPAATSTLSEQFTDVTVAEDGTIHALSKDSGHGESFSVVAGPAIVSLGTFGNSGVVGAPGSLYQPSSITTDRTGLIYVRDIFHSDTSYFISVFNPDRTFERKIHFKNSFVSEKAIEAGFGELLLGTRNNNPISGTNYLPLLDPLARAVLVLDGTERAVGFLNFPAQVRASQGFADTDDLAFADADTVYATQTLDSRDFVVRYRRAFRTYDPTFAGIPVPDLISAASQPGTTLFEIQYRVDDEDSATVTTAMIALEDGIRDLDSVHAMLSLTGSVGAGVPTGSTQTATWDAGVDLAGLGDFINAKIRVMAQDDRMGLMDLHFITIPQSVCSDTEVGGDLMINVSPIDTEEMLDAWFWLIATNDSAITFSSGQVLGVGGNFDGLLLAENTMTTPDGRAFLFERMLAREANAAEVTCAKEATTPGLVNQFAPANRFGNRPELVNEFGFDTGTSVSGYWVVPTP